jgi:hypothetical protein
MTEPRVRVRAPWLDRQRDFSINRAPSRGAWKTEAPQQPDATPNRGAWTPEGPSKRPPVPMWVTGAVFVCVLFVFVGVVIGPVGGDSNVTGALVVAPFLFYFTYRIARRFAAADSRPELIPILMGGFCLKVIGALVRYWVSAVVYSSTGDFYDYDKWGKKLSVSYRHLHWMQPGGKRLAGTNFIRVLTGLIYTVTPRELMAGFLVYAWLSFLGLLFFWRAYRIAISPRWDVTYLKWIVLLPSLLYWPSAMGKDAYMLFAMGLTSFGVACILSRRMTRGLLATSLGLLAICMVRPHIGLVVLGGLALAVLFRRYRGGFMAALFSVAFVLGASFLVMGAAQSFFGIQTFNRSSIQNEINDVSQHTSEGTSNFKPVVVNSPVTFPLAAATVLYRPMPFESRSAQEVLTGIEGVVLIVLSIRAFPRSIRALRYARGHPYFVYCLGAMIVFIIAFSGFSNFGLLARERTVIAPLLLVFLSLPVDVRSELSDAPMEPRARPALT